MVQERPKSFFLQLTSYSVTSVTRVWFFLFYMIVGEFQLLWSSQRKIVCSQLDQGQISNSVNQIHCSPLFLSFAFLAKGQIDTQICSRGNAVWKSFYDMMKWLLEGTNLLRKIHIFVMLHTIYDAFPYKAR